MLDRMCAHQQDVIDAAMAGRQPDATLARHVAGCASCREAAEVVRWMQQLSQEPAPAHTMPNPDVIWWKAQLLRRWEVERKAAAPIEHMHKAEIFAGVAGFLAFLLWQWSGLTRIVSTSVPSMLANWTARAATTSPASDTASFGVILGALFIGAMILAGVHRMLAD